jgi:DNA modification methylase
MGEKVQDPQDIVAEDIASETITNYLNVPDIDVEDVIISSDYRVDKGDVGELALSIKKIGLLHPIRLRRCGDKFDIDVGRRRFRALTELLKVKTLKYGTHFLFSDESTDALLMQLVENMSRKNFHPLEAANLIYDIHSKHVKKHGAAVRGQKGGWGAKDTARVTNMAPSTVSQYIRLWVNRDAFSEIERDEMTNISDTILELRRRRTGTMLRRVRQQISDKVQSGLPKTAIELLDRNLSNFKHMDARDFVKTIPKIDHVIIDPPYAVELDKSGIGTYEYECYKDDEEEYIELMEELVPKFANMVDCGYIIIWCAFIKFEWLRQLAIKNDIVCSRVPIIWRKTNTGGTGSNLQKLLPIVTECALYGWRGDATIMGQGKDNCFNYPTPKKDRIHVAQKEVSLQRAILKTFTAEGDRILDCFAGSASMLRACTELNRVCYSCEKDIHSYNSAVSLCSEMFKPKEDVYDVENGEENSELDEFELSDD